MAKLLLAEIGIGYMYWTREESRPSVMAITTIPVVGGANDTYSNHHPSSND
jgi:hypothetical protein